MEQERVKKSVTFFKCTKVLMSLRVQFIIVIPLEQSAVGTMPALWAAFVEVIVSRFQYEICTFLIRTDIFHATQIKLFSSPIFNSIRYAELLCSHLTLISDRVPSCQLRRQYIQRGYFH